MINGEGGGFDPGVTVKLLIKLKFFPLMFVNGLIETIIRAVWRNHYLNSTICVAGNSACPEWNTIVSI